MSTVNGPPAAFGVGFTRVGDGGVAMDQYVGPAVTDHRGLVEMPAYAVMAEPVATVPDPVGTRNARAVADIAFDRARAF